MDTAVDYYQILGVLPSAEQIVITAAFRALASRYHPDKWSGDKMEANRRMTEINGAYEVLGDPEKRAAYDRARSSSTSSFGDNADQVDDAFDSAMQELEERWQTAVSLMPDLQKIRNRLSKTAHRLAFAFVVVMLESKQFQKRAEIAASLEKNFLEQYFGTDPEILSFARLLISTGHRQPIKALNKLIDVVGAGVPASVIKQKIMDEFRIKPYLMKQVEGEPLRKLKEAVLRWDDHVAALSLVRASGLDYSESGGGVFSPKLYEIFVADPDFGMRKTVMPKSTAAEAVKWVQVNLC